jgi:hypothetical protein
MQQRTKKLIATLVRKKIAIFCSKKWPQKTDPNTGKFFKLTSGSKNAA